MGSGTGWCKCAGYSKYIISSNIITLYAGTALIGSVLKHSRIAAISGISGVVNGASLKAEEFQNLKADVDKN